MKSLAERKAERAERKNKEAELRKEDGIPEGQHPLDDNDNSGGDTGGKPFGEQSFAELKAYVEERGETVKPGTSTADLVARATELSTKSQQQGNGAGSGNGGWGQ